MNFDEMNELERKNLLEEIRKRAEEAELARIEAEEIRLNQGLTPVSASPVDIKVQIPEPEPAANRKPEFVFQQKLFEPSPSVFDEPKKVSVVEQLSEMKRGTVIRIGQESEATEHPEKRQKRKKLEQKRVAELLKTADANYQSEKYEEALRDVREVLELDPENSEALTRQSAIGTAKQLSDRLKEEEARRIEAEEADEAKKQVPLPSRKAVVEKTIVEPQVISPEKNPAEEISTKAQEPQREPASKIAKRKQLNRQLARVGIAALVLLGIAAAFVVYDNVRDKIFPSRANILILPANSATLEEYFVEGLTEELIGSLSQVQGVNVVSSQTSFNVASLDAAYSVVGVAYLLQWSVERRGEDFDVQLRLTDSNKKVVLENTISVSHENVAAFCDQVVPPIGAAIGASDDAMQKRKKSFTTNANAFATYLRARYYMRQPERVSLDSVATLLAEARELDREFAPLEIALGWTNLLKFETSEHRDQTQLDEANKNILRAINLGAKSSDVLTLWASVEYHRSNFADAIQRFMQATQISPSNAEAWRRLSLAFLRKGKNEEALDAAQRATEWDPLNARVRQLRGAILVFNNENGAAAKEFELVRERDNGSDVYLAALLKSNQPERALDILKERTLADTNNFIALYDFGRMLQLAGKPKADWESAFTKALAIIDDTLKSAPKFALAHSYRGLIHTRLGIFEEAIAANGLALSLDPRSVKILYNSARMYALQNDKAGEAIAHLNAAAERWFVLSEFLDLDLTSLRTNPSFAAVIVRQ